MSHRIERIVDSGSVKMLRFNPSRRVLWMVVGKDSEYWTDPDLNFCSCKDYYFSSLSRGEPCYHLKSIRKAIMENKFTLLEFSDEEYGIFLRALAQDIEIQLLYQ